MESAVLVRLLHCMGITLESRLVQPSCNLLLVAFKTSIHLGLLFFFLITSESRLHEVSRNSLNVYLESQMLAALLVLVADSLKSGVLLSRPHSLAVIVKSPPVGILVHFAVVFLKR